MQFYINLSCLNDHIFYKLNKKEGNKRKIKKRMLKRNSKDICQNYLLVNNVKHYERYY